MPKKAASRKTTRARPPPSARRAPPAPPRRSAALARAERGSAPVHLTAAEGRLLDRALSAGQDLRDRVTGAVLEFGRWLLVEVFVGEAKAALDERGRNPVWLELTRRAGGPTFEVSRRVLSVALRVAANDKRITDQAWQRLDLPRKELLLPLREADSLREAAQHVSKWNLTQAKTRIYVTELLAEHGKERQVRLTRRGLVARVQGLRARLDSAAVLAKVVELGARMNDRQRAEVVRELDELRAVLRDLAAAVKRR